MYINPSPRPLVSLTPRVSSHLSSCELLLCQVPPLPPRTILPPLSSSTSPPHAHCQYLDQLSTLTTAISLADCDICVLIVLKFIFYEAAICSIKVLLQILLIDCLKIYFRKLPHPHESVSPLRLIIHGGKCNKNNSVSFFYN